MQNRLEVELALQDIESGIARLRATKTEMRELEGAATKAERGVDKLGDEFEDSGRKAERFGRSTGKASREADALSRVAASGVSRLAALGGAAAGAAASLAVIGTIRIGAGFEEQMSGVLAITRATDDQFKALEETARDLGATTVFSAQQAAEGMEFLARAGFNAEQIIGALPGTLDLAAAGALDLGSAADIASNVLQGFRLNVEEANRVADVLAKAAATTNTNVLQLGEGLKLVAPVAAGLGVSMEITTAAIGELSNAGLQASLAGTGLRRVLTELASPQKELQKLLGDTTLQADGFVAVMQKLRDANIDTAQAIEIFGQRGGPAFEVLLDSFRRVDANGVSSLERLSAALDKAGGFAQETAETMTDNFNGAVKQAQSALQELFLTAATDSGALEGLTEVVEDLTTILRSDAAKEFAQDFGEGFLATINAASAGVQYMSDVFRGLSVVINEVGDDIADFLGLDILQRLAEIPQLREAAANAAGNIINPADPVLDLLAGIGEKAREANAELKALEQTSPVQIGIVTNLDDITAAVGTAEERAAAFETRMAEIGEGTALGGLLRGFDNFNKSLVAANDNAKTVAATIESIKPPEVGAVQQALLDQVAIAERLAEAAKGGKIAFEIEVNAVELDALAQQAVDKAKEAGEELSFATARILVGQIDGLEKAAQAMLDAEEALRERAADRADRIADDLLGRIDQFSSNVQDADLRRAGVDATPLIAALDRQFLRLADEIDDASIGLNVEQLEDLYKALEDAGIQLGNKIEEAAESGGLGLAAKIRAALDDGVSGLSIAANLTADFSDIGARFFDQLGSAVEAFRRAGEKTFESVTRLISGIATSAENGLKGLADVIGGKLGGFLGQAGEVAGAVGAVAGLISSAVGFFKDLFGKRSDFTAQGVFNPVTGRIAGVDQDKGAGENAQARDALIKSITEASKSLAEIVGGAVSSALINVAVRSDRKTGEPFVDVGFQSPSGEPVGGGRFSDPEAAFEKAIQLVISSLKGGEKALVDYAKAAAATGRDFETIVSGLQEFQSVLEIGAEPLSDVGQALKRIDDVTGPVIADLQALGLSIAGVANAANTAGRAVGVDFIERIQGELDRAENAALAEFKDLLRNQAQDLQDATTLLNRGFINQDEFRLVEQNNAVQQRAFFENLDEDALNDLGDYLGLIRENGGEAAVVLLQFNQELDRTREQLTSGLSAMREEADRFFNAARANLNLSDDIRFRLSEQTGTDQLLTFRRELESLLAQAQGPDRTAAVEAAERAPDVARQFIELAERQFGASGGLGAARDFVTDILDRVGAAAQGFGNETLDAISLAEQQISLLDRVVGALESPDPALDVLQSILAAGELQNATLRDLLDQYVQLSYDSPSQSFTPGQVQQAAQQIVLPSDLRITNTVTTDAPTVTLAINAAAAQAREDSQAAREIAEANEKRLGEMQEAITKLDSTLRRQTV